MNAKQVSVLFLTIAFTTTLLATSHVSAAPGGRVSSSRYSSSERDSGPAMGEGSMLMDLSAMYTRDTRPDGLSDLGTRLSIGGMFTSYVGLDLQGTFEVKSRNYLLGADLRIAPVKWFFVKAGVGGYSAKEKRTFQLVPLGGFGIIAPLTDAIYLVSELTYFQVSSRNHLSFGGGLGIHF